MTDRRFSDDQELGLEQALARQFLQQAGVDVGKLSRNSSPFSDLFSSAGTGATPSGIDDDVVRKLAGG
jgi:hypothetical protein